MEMTIINNYEMPSNCYMCDLHNYHECDLTGESIEEDYCWNGNSREKHCPLREIEAIPKADCENRLKADMEDMLKELQYDLYQALCHEIHGKEDCPCTNQTTSCLATFRVCDADRAIGKVIQQKINKLKENKKWNG